MWRKGEHPILFFALAAVLLLSDCSRRGEVEDRKKLTGTWLVEGSYPKGGDFKSTITIDSDGHYVCQVLATSPDDSVTRTGNLAGTFEIKHGVLTDTMTKYSNTNLAQPIISQFWIIRMDDRELVVKWKPGEGEADYPTNEFVFRKEIKRCLARRGGRTAEAETYGDEI
jgi:hypothetical protein